MIAATPNEFLGDTSPENQPHSLCPEPCYIRYKHLKDYTPRYEIKKGAWVVDIRNGDQGKLLKIGRKRRSRGLFGWMEHPARVRIVSLKFLVAMPHTYAFLRSKKTGNIFDLFACFDCFDCLF